MLEGENVGVRIKVIKLETKEDWNKKIGCIPLSSSSGSLLPTL